MTETSREHVTVYTDGGCDPNPGVGGWGVVLLCGDTRKELSGGDENTTNNRMEMTAAIEALSALKRSCSVKLLTDSEYLKRGITEWLPQWKRRNWKRKGGPVANEDLWRTLDELSQRHEIVWSWVPAHMGIPENERCDELATAEISRLKSE